jgi:hypothetical protein
MRSGYFFHLMVLIIFCGCQKNNPKSNSDLEMQILMLSNRVSLTEKILRYAILEDTSTNVYEKLISGEYDAKNVLDDKNLEVLRSKIDTILEDEKNNDFPNIDLENRSIIYEPKCSIGNIVVLIEKVLDENGSLIFYSRLINPTAVEILAGQFTISCETKSENRYKRKTGRYQFNNLKPGESVLLKVSIDDTNYSEILDAKMIVWVKDIRYIEK